MAHHVDRNVFETVMQLLTDAGFDGFAQAFQILINEAMKTERADALQARPYERTDARRGYANGFKPKTVATRIGKIPLRVPQVRGDVAFYPSALERGVRSERALKLAVADTRAGDHRASGAWRRWGGLLSPQAITGPATVCSADGRPAPVSARLSRRAGTTGRQAS